jgi:hypothetical protein
MQKSFSNIKYVEKSICQPSICYKMLVKMGCIRICCRCGQLVGCNVVTLAGPIIKQFSLFVVLISRFQSRCLDAFLLRCYSVMSHDDVMFSNI